MPGTRLLVWIRHVLRRGAVEESLDDEIRSYLEHDVDARVTSGTPRQARREAVLELGGREQVKPRGGPPERRDDPGRRRGRGARQRPPIQRQPYDGSAWRTRQVGAAAGKLG